MARRREREEDESREIYELKPGGEIEQDNEPTIFAPPSASHIEAPDLYASGAEPEDWAEFKEALDQGSWVGCGSTCVLPGGGNHPKGRKR